MGMDILLHLVLALALCLAISALGFRRIDYFVSLGYGLSIAAQAIVFLALYRGTASGWVIVQVLLLLAYGARLSAYLISRERSASFGAELEASKARGAHIKGTLKLTIWVGVAALYVAMFSPGLFSLLEQSRGLDLWSVPLGVVIMIAGLALESFADWQKSRLKAANPKGFVSSGLYRLVRYPNYFGEMVFWLGAWVSGIAAYQSPLAWLLSLAGFVSIQLVMLGSTRRLELKQGERYGADPAYQAYVKTVPVLIPLVPLYSVKNNRIYLG